ncbi:MAG: threonylcarbamoyl-AMP synthase [Candidatus Diapherotrites archaeon]|nr:threonylcarbamoyl-AMP synthase [Candidatus Diapherotrites archaeon]
MAILKADSPGIVERAVSVLDGGMMAVYPTDTLYAIGADATRHDCVRQIFTLKKRDPEQPISVMVSSFRMLKAYAEVTPEQEAILKQLLPGKVTVVLEGRGFAKNLSPSGIGFRLPLNPLAAEIVESFNKPITATSANPAGEEAATTAEEAYRYFGDLVELYIDAGEIAGASSTVLDLRDTPEILREGSDHEKVLNAIAQK